MENKCTKILIERVRVLRERDVAWSAIADVVGVSRSSLNNYNNPESAEYSAGFAMMVIEAEEKLCDLTKTGQFKQSVKHTLKKTLWEYHRIDSRSLDKNDKKYKKGKNELLPAPEMPPTWFTKPYLIDYADQVLDLELYPNMTIAEMRAECLLQVKALTVTVRVRIESEQEVDPSHAAVKNVLTNTGDKDKRWNFQTDIKHDIEPKTIADIAAAMGIGSDSDN